MQGRPVSLIGLPGVGKSTLARKLARQLDMQFIDLDREVERNAGRTISDIFVHDGESRFRDLEAEALRAVADRGACVVATGGGVVLSEANRAVLSGQTHCIYLKASLVLLAGRVAKSQRRPLFRDVDPVERLRTLAAERDPLYAATAADVVDVDGRAAEHVVRELVMLVASAA